MTTTTKPPAATAKAYIYNEVQPGLDLTQEMEQATATYGWDDATAADAERCYRDFLWVCWNYDQQPLAAISALADKVWHCHMLLPKKYSADCARIFGDGNILDHIPNLPKVGSVGPDDEAAAKAAYQQLDVKVPEDLVYRCVWAVVENQ